MAKIEKYEGDYVVELLAQVLNGTMDMADARTALRVYVGKLPAEQQAEFKQKGTTRGRYLITVAEAFYQELTVIGAGQ